MQFIGRNFQNTDFLVGKTLNSNVIFGFEFVIFHRILKKVIVTTNIYFLRREEFVNFVILNGRATAC